MKYLLTMFAGSLRNSFVSGMVVMGCLLGFPQATVIFCDTSGAMGFGAGEIKRALGAAAVLSPEETVSSVEPEQIIITVRSHIPLMGLIETGGESLPSAAKKGSYWIRVTSTGPSTRYWAVGIDTAGAMYGALEIAEAVLEGGLSSVVRGDHVPHIQERGIKFNIPLDPRSPSYNDAADNSWNNVETMWDFGFWKEYLDNLARYRYNALTLWNIHPFPSMVKVPEYPDIALNDVMKNTVDFDCGMDATNMLPQEVIDNLVVIKTMTIEEKIDYWKKVMQYGRDRGIDFYIITWNIYPYGTFGKYGITEDRTNQTTIDYYRKSVKALILTYPLLKGIGITAGEYFPGASNDQKEDWLWQTYGLGMMDAKAENPGRSVKLIHRTWQSGIPMIAGKFAAFSDSMDYEYKYSIGHMFSSVTPDFADATIASLPKGKRLWLTVRNDDFFMTRWGDAEYARAYIKNMPPSSTLAGFMMGSDNYIWGRETMSTEPETPRQQTLNKHWYYFMLFGRLAYDPDIPVSTFQGMMARKFPSANIPDLYEGWAYTSNILPLITRFHFWGADFQWYPEACMSSPNHPDAQGFHGIDVFIHPWSKPQSGVDMMSIPDFVDGRTYSDSTPPVVAGALKWYADEGLKKIAGLNPGNDKELRLTLGDIRAIASLGYYYSEKILGTTEWASGNQDEAVEHLKLAAAHWRAYASLISSQYHPWKIARIAMIDVKALWQDVLNDIVIAGGSAEIASSQPAAGGSVIEAETSVLSGATAVTSSDGTGYAAIDQAAGGSIAFTVTAGTAGLYLLEFRYAKSSGDVPGTLSVNGAVTDRTLSFWGTGSDDIWQAETRYVNLAAGANTVTLTTTGVVSAVDHLNLVRVGEAVSSARPGKSVVPPRIFLQGSTLMLNFELSAISPVAIKIFDCLGKEVEAVSSEARPAGSHSISFDTSHLPTGLYFIKLDSGNDRAVRKILLEQ